MFNAGRPDELLLAVGRVLRDAGRAAGAPDDHGRSQLLSAYSITRNMAAEQAAAPALLRWAQDELGALLAGSDDPAVAACREAIAAAIDGPALGPPLATLLLHLRTSGSPLRDPVRRVVAELAEREVRALAEAPR